MGRGALCLGLGIMIGLAGCLPGYLSNQKAGKEGCFALPIESVDADGKYMRLSEYSDKIVLLSFWHSQCPPCRGMFTHEKKLVQKYQDRPFVLLGVNSDPSPYVLKKTQTDAGLTWTSFWDEGGRIAAAWGVEMFPAFFLIDQQGIVRWRHVGVPSEGEIEKKIDELLSKES